MKHATLTVLIFFFFSVSFAQVYKGQLEFGKIPVPAHHYQQEYTFDTTLNVAAWVAQKKGLHVSFASPDASYMRSEVPERRMHHYPSKALHGKENA